MAEKASKFGSQAGGIYITELNPKTKKLNNFPYSKDSKDVISRLTKIANNYNSDINDEIENNWLLLNGCIFVLIWCLILIIFYLFFEYSWISIVFIFRI